MRKVKENADQTVKDETSKLQRILNLSRKTSTLSVHPAVQWKVGSFWDGCPLSSGLILPATMWLLSFAFLSLTVRRGRLDEKIRITAAEVVNFYYVVNTL